MTPWLKICGAGLVYSLPSLAQHSAITLPRVKAQAESFSAPNLQDLPELLSKWRAKPCPPLRRIPVYARMGLLAALQALEASGWGAENAAVLADDAQDTGHVNTALILGTAHSGIVMSMDFMDSILDAEPRLSSPTAFSHAVNNMGAGLMSLLLDVRGPCQTVSQFELSFAGAVQAAALLLHNGRVDRALVGAMDEVDTRFSACCPTMTKSAQGAVFFCMEKAQNADEKALLRVCFGPKNAFKHPADRLLLSGTARSSEAMQGENLSPYYGASMLAQALDTYLAYKAQGTTLCLCSENNYGHCAVVEVRS